MSKALDGPLNNSNSNLVPEAMVHALTSDSPKYRYRVGKDSKPSRHSALRMGERVQDFAMTRGGSKNPPRTSPEDGRSIALNRYESTSAWVYAGVAALAVGCQRSFPIAPYNYVYKQHESKRLNSAERNSECFPSYLAVSFVS